MINFTILTNIINKVFIDVFKVIIKRNGKNDKYSKKLGGLAKQFVQHFSKISFPTKCEICLFIYFKGKTEAGGQPLHPPASFVCTDTALTFPLLHPSLLGAVEKQILCVRR